MVVSLMQTLLIKVEYKGKVWIRHLMEEIDLLTQYLKKINAWEWWLMQTSEILRCMKYLGLTCGFRKDYKDGRGGRFLNTDKQLSCVNN